MGAQFTTLNEELRTPNGPTRKRLPLSMWLHVIFFKASNMSLSITKKIIHQGNWSWSRSCRYANLLLLQLESTGFGDFF